MRTLNWPETEVSGEMAHEILQSERNAKIEYILK